VERKESDLGLLYESSKCLLLVAKTKFDASNLILPPLYFGVEL
jgi:hypothetical protein